MDLLTFFRVLRRRWLLILLCVIVGAGIGVATSLFNTTAAKQVTYYKATNTQIFDESSGNSKKSLVTNLDQIAILVTTGDVPNRVATELGNGKTGRQLAEHITTTTNGATSTLDITAVGKTPRAATKLADSFATQIGASLTARDVALYNQTGAELNKQLDDLKAQADGFLAQLNQYPPPPDAGIIQRQYDATQNQYYAAYGQLQAISSAGPPTSRLSTLEPAMSVPISASEYQTRLDLGALGRNHFKADNSGGAGSSAFQVSGDSLFQGRTARGILGALLGFLAGVGLAVLADRVDRRIRTREDAETAFGLPVLAEIPKFSRGQSRETDLLAFTSPRSRATEAYRAIRTSLLFQQASGLGRNGQHPTAADEIFEPRPNGPQEPFVVMVTSASPGEGKSTTSANLAAVFAETGSTVLVVNCDFRRPSIHRRFGVEDEARRVQETQVPNIKIVTDVVGDPNANPAAVVAAQRQVIAAARKRFDVIILDTAPLLTANDAIEAAGSADLVVLVARVNLTTTDKVHRSMEMLTRLEAPLGGVVLVATTDAQNDYYYYYQQQDRRKRSDRQAVSANGNGTGKVEANGRASEMFPADRPGEPERG